MGDAVARGPSQTSRGSGLMCRVALQRARPSLGHGAPVTESVFTGPRHVAPRTHVHTRAHPQMRSRSPGHGFPQFLTSSQGYEAPQQLTRHPLRWVCPRDPRQQMPWTRGSHVGPPTWPLPAAARGHSLGSTPPSIRSRAWALWGNRGGAGSSQGRSTVETRIHTKTQRILKEVCDPTCENGQLR